jgi:hypothetical protein
MLKVFRKIRSLITIYSSMHPSGTRQFCGKSGDFDVELDDVETHDSNVIRHSLKEQDQASAGETGYRALQVLLRGSNQEVVGGVLGVTFWEYLQINTIWIHPRHRDQSHLTRMFDVAEGEAARRRCTHVILSVYSFQELLSFCQTRGYEVYGVLEDYPAGRQRFSLRKRLGRPETAEGLEAEVASS